MSVRRSWCAVVALAVEVVACSPKAAPEPPPPSGEARVEVHPSMRFREVRRIVRDLTTARYPGMHLVVRGSDGATSDAGFELYGRHETEPLAQLVVIKISQDEVRVGDRACGDADATAEAVRERASGPADLALVRVHDETTAERVVDITRILRQAGFERVTLSSLEPMRHVAQTRKEWGRSAEDCPFAERLDSAMATLEIEGDGLGGIGSVKILSQDFQDAAYSGALCLSAMPFPTDVAPKWRLRMRFSR